MGTFQLNRKTDGEPGRAERERPAPTRDLIRIMPAEGFCFPLYERIWAGPQAPVLSFVLRKKEGKLQNGRCGIHTAGKGGAPRSRADETAMGSRVPA